MRRGASRLGPDSSGPLGVVGGLVVQHAQYRQAPAGPTAGRYYVGQVAQGREDYYAGEGEDPGVWFGAGGGTLGMSRRMSEQGVVRLLSGCDPASGDALRRPLARGRVAAFDLTFRAPKSVSLLSRIG